MAERVGVLVMAYGTPRSLDDVEAYYTDIRHGSPPPPDLLRNLTDRYRAIGGRSPLLEITVAQQKGIEARLSGIKSYLGQKHARPSIPDAITAMAEDGVDRVIGLVLAPHYSSLSIGDYAGRAQKAAAEVGLDIPIDMIESWHLEPAHISWLATRVREAIESLPPSARARSTVAFTAHSLPARILKHGDPYPDHLSGTARAVAAEAGLDGFEVAWQSAGRSAEPWLGPDIRELIRELADRRLKGVVVCPCGFVSDHLEVLYDIDIEAAAVADEAGLALARTRSPNDDPEFLDMLAAVVRRAIDSGS